MRTLIVLIYWLGTGHTLFAQLAPKEIAIGGALGFESDKEKIDDPFGTKSSYKSFNIGPILSFGLGGNWMAGVGARYANGKQTNENQSTSQSIYSYVMQFSVFARRYHPFNKQFGIYLQAGPNVGFGKQTRKTNQSSSFKTDLDFYSLSANPGLYFKPSKKFIIEAIFGEIIFTHSIATPETGFKSYSDLFDINLTEAISLGVKYVL